MRVRIPSYYYTDSAAAVSPPVGLAQARPNKSGSILGNIRMYVRSVICAGAYE